MAVVTWNPADATSGCTFSNGNLTATSGSPAPNGTRATQNLNGGKFYWEVTWVSGPTQAYQGIALSTANISADLTTQGNVSVVIFTNGNIYQGGTNTGNTLGSYSTGAFLCFAIDAPNSRFWVRLNATGPWNGATLGGNPAAGTGYITLPQATAWMPFVQTWTGSGDVWTANFGPSGFAGTAPSGFAGLSTPTTAQLTQIAAEQWASGNTALQAQLTQIAIEQWAAVALVNPQAVLTQIALEQWASVAQAGAAPAQARVMVMA